MSARNRLKDKRKTKVLIADREGIFRLGLKKLFSVEDDLRVVAQAENAEQTLAMAKSFKPDLIVVQREIAADEHRNLIAQIHRQAPLCRIIVTASIPAEDNTKRFLEAGASCVVSKSLQPELFVKTARSVVESKTTTPADQMPEAGEGIAAIRDQQLRPVDTLTRRERTIVSCLTQGWRNREIAERLKITEQTVKNHLRSIYDKVGVSDRLELVLYAIHQQLELPSVEALA